MFNTIHVTTVASHSSCLLLNLVRRISSTHRPVSVYAKSWLCSSDHGNVSGLVARETFQVDGGTTGLSSVDGWRATQVPWRTALYRVSVIFDYLLEKLLDSRVDLILFIFVEMSDVVMVEAQAPLLAVANFDLVRSGAASRHQEDLHTTFEKKTHWVRETVCWMDPGLRTNFLEPTSLCLCCYVLGL